MTGTNTSVTLQVGDVACNVFGLLSLCFVDINVVYWLLETRMAAGQLKTSPVFMEEEDLFIMTEY